MKYWDKIKKAAGLLLGGMLLVGAGGCGLMHDDLDPCAVKPNTKTTVSFIYNYNTSDKDMFAESVGGVTLYVFDADGTLVDLREFSNATSGSALKRGNFKVEFNSTEIQPGHKYTFCAVAHAHDQGYTGAVSLPGVAFRRTEMQKGSSTRSDYSILLDRDGDGVVDHDGVMIDALWMTHTPVTVDVPEEREPAEGDPQEEDHLINVVIPLQRVTNTVKVTVFEKDFPWSIDPAHYDMRIITNSGAGRLDIVGAPIDNARLTYKPVGMSTCRRDIDGINTACITAEFGMSRLLLNSDVKIEIYSRLTGRTTTLANLPSFLAQGNDEFAQKHWSMQEYLDRQYEFEIDVPLGDEVPKWIQINIGILSWSKRIQIEQL